MNRVIVKTIIWLTIFSIAMGFLETSVVVYLREIYYPEGFKFPLVAVPRDIATTEFFREIATIIMLIGAGVMAGKTAYSDLYFSFTVSLFGISFITCF